jgi:hypothetical protein
MSQRRTPRLAVETAEEVCGRFPLGDAARALLAEGIDPETFLERLLEAEQYVDAARFLAHALPKREAVWWACRSARRVSGPKPAPEIEAAVRVAEAWVVDPTEENRRPAMAAAEAATFATPAGCAAVSAFWSGGSLAPPAAPVVPPGEYMTALGASAAVLLAGADEPAGKLAAAYRALIADGLAIARGEGLWAEPAPKAPEPMPRKAAPSELKQPIRWE